MRGFQALGLTTALLLGGCGREPASTATSNTSSAVTRTEDQSADSYKMLHGKDAELLCQALDASYDPEKGASAELRRWSKTGKIRVDVIPFEMPGFGKFITIEKGKISLSTISDKDMETLTLGDDGKLTRKLENWSYKSGVGDLISEEVVTDAALAKKVSDAAENVGNALKTIQDAKSVKSGRASGVDGR